MKRSFRHSAELLIVLIGAVFGADAVVRLLNQADDLLVTTGVISAFLGIWIVFTSIRRIVISWKSDQQS